MNSPIVILRTPGVEDSYPTGLFPFFWVEIRACGCFPSYVFPITAILIALYSRYVDLIDDIFFFSW